jgi:hypothetical protein
MMLRTQAFSKQYNFVQCTFFDRWRDSWMRPTMEICLVSDRSTDTNPSNQSTRLSRGPLWETGSIFQASAGFGDLTTTWKARYFAPPPQAQSESVVTSNTRKHNENTTKTLPLILLPQHRTTGSDKLENCNNNGLELSKEPKGSRILS